MRDRPKFFDDLAGVAGGAFSALAGARDELETLIRARLDETIRRLDLVRREELDAAMELAGNARAGQEAADARVAALEARVAALEAARDHAVGIEAPAPDVAPAAVPPAADDVPPMDI